MVVVAEVGDVITAVPDVPTKVQAPVPTVGMAAIVKVAVLHFVWSTPAAATGDGVTVIVASLVVIPFPEHNPEFVNKALNLVVWVKFVAV